MRRVIGEVSRRLIAGANRPMLVNHVLTVALGRLLLPDGCASRRRFILCCRMIDIAHQLRQEAP
jgi:hypothetical protein